jgi:digalactosyldiacylglycerol synthase
VQFSTQKRSILPVGDITQAIPDDKADIAVLEEPEHLTWYHHGRRWKNKFRKVIGVVHTNYLEYVKREKNGYISAFFLKHINSWVTDIYCHKVSSSTFGSMLFLFFPFQSLQKGLYLSVSVETELKILL